MAYPINHNRHEELAKFSLTYTPAITGLRAPEIPEQTRRAVSSGAMPFDVFADLLEDADHPWADVMRQLHTSESVTLEYRWIGENELRFPHIQWLEISKLVQEVMSINPKQEELKLLNMWPFAKIKVVTLYQYIRYRVCIYKDDVLRWMVYKNTV